ncbi:MAG: hypothetical protein K9W44_16560 [Candidatus Lokiarchaeota archaeon]|nr:hypothetical protein [Candidatus Harpocratesius repetitus]
MFSHEIISEDLELGNPLIDERQLKKFLSHLRENSDIFNAILFNDDGLEIAFSDSNMQGNFGHKFFQDLSAISSGIISMANSLVLMTNPSSIVTKVNIQASCERDVESFGMIFTSITEEFHLVVVFPTNANVGLINFEINQLKEKLLTYLS